MQSISLLFNHVALKVVSVAALAVTSLATQTCEAQQKVNFTVTAEVDPVPFTDFHAYWYGTGKRDDKNGLLRVQMRVNWFNKTTNPDNSISLTNVKFVVRHGNKGKPLYIREDLNGSVARDPDLNKNVMELRTPGPDSVLVMRGIVVEPYIGPSPHPAIIPDPIVGPKTVEGFAIIPE